MGVYPLNILPHLAIPLFTRKEKFMKKLAISLLLFYSLSVQAQFFDSLSRPNAWFRADKSSLSATQWTDISGNKRHASALTGENPVSTGLLNFNKALLFDGVNDYLKLPLSLEGLPEFTIITVFQSADTTERGAWGAENALSRNVMLTTRKATGPDAITDYYGKNENRAVLQTNSQSWEGTTTKSADAFLALGSTGKTRGGKPFKGLIAEWMVFTRSLSFLERLQIETYLALKYGASMPSHNYISSDEKVLWKAEDNKNYLHRVAGIGRDDAFQLYQKQSHSAYDSGLITISVGPLVNSNDENVSSLNHGDFIMWGDDNGNRSSKAGQGKDSVLSTIKRHWLLTATGETASQIATEVKVDIAQFPKTALDYWLVIDRSGQENFSVDNLEYILPDRKTADGKVIYKVKWDTDRSGKDNFGFARARSLFGVVRTLKNPSCTDETAGHTRMEIISGHAPFHYTLTSTANRISREGSTSQKSFEQRELLKGSYVFTLQDAVGDELVRNFELIMPDGLTIDLGADQKLQPGSEIVIDIKSQVPDSITVSYLWENNFGFRSSGSKVTISESGIYQATVTKQRDGCVFSDDIAISGTDEQKFAVFPTVINRGDTYNISISLPEAGPVWVEVYDLKGMVYQTITDDGNSEYHFKTTLGNSGMYMVMMRTSRGSQSKKVIVN
jgi:hypothetical protein